MLEFDIPTKHINIASPQALVSIQDALNDIREFEETFPMMSHLKIADAFGKQDLGSGKLVGITLVLLDGWRFFAEGFVGPGITLVTVTGGNLVGDTTDPVDAAANVTYVIEQDTSAAIISLPTMESNLVTAIDHQAGNRSIDFAGNDALGWQEIVMDEATGLSEVARYNLFSGGSRITDTASSFVAAGKMIDSRVKV